jgi:hypothetical protein
MTDATVTESEATVPTLSRREHGRSNIRFTRLSVRRPARAQGRLHDLHSETVAVSIAVREAVGGGQKALCFIETRCGRAGASRRRQIADTHDLDLQVRSKVYDQGVRSRRFP